LGTLEFKTMVGLFSLNISLVIHHEVILRSIIRGLFALLTGNTYFWLRPMRLDLTLYSSYCLRNLFDKFRAALRNVCFIFVHTQASSLVHIGLGFLWKEWLLVIFICFYLLVCSLAVTTKTLCSYYCFRASF
jgi:hypothetical protein